MANINTDDNILPLSGPVKLYTTPIYVYTGIFGAIFIFGPLLVKRGPNRSITQVCIMLSTFCCWIFMTTLYIVQMNPLLGPRLANHSLAWIGHKWGHDPASLAALNTTPFISTTEGASSAPDETTTEVIS